MHYAYHAQEVNAIKNKWHHIMNKGKRIFFEAICMLLIQHPLYRLSAGFNCISKKSLLNLMLC